MALCTFQLYWCTNKHSAFGYPFIAVCSEHTRAFYITHKSIDMDTFREHEKEVFTQDYTATPQIFAVDIDALDDLIEAYIGQRQYLLTIYSTSQRIYLVYRSHTDDQHHEVEVSGSQEAKKITEMVHKLFGEIKEKIFGP